MQVIIGLLFTHAIVDSNCLNVPTVFLDEKELNIEELNSSFFFRKSIKGQL